MAITKKQKIGILVKVIENFKQNKYSGWDPYDALNSDFLTHLNSSITRLLISQFLVYSPINLRSILRIKKGINPKSVALFLQTLCKLQSINRGFKFERDIKILSNWLIKNRSEGYSGACWGYNFPWQSQHSFQKSNTPTVVNTYFAANSLMDSYELTGEESYLKTAISSADFVTKDLKQNRFREGISFSYFPNSDDTVHNANALGAALLSRIYFYNRDEILKKKATQAMNYIISEQKSSGMWAYSISYGKDKLQTDWHQGFILDSILDFINFCKPSNSDYFDKMILGADFYYNNQFTSSGKSYWRFPRKWPIDVHNQAQGVITFTKLSKYNSKFLILAENILNWTIDNMYDGSGYFYFQKWPLLKNKIVYMRWSQSWMALALAESIAEIKNLQQSV